MARGTSGLAICCGATLTKLVKAMKHSLSHLLRGLLTAFALIEGCLVDSAAQNLQNRPLPPLPAGTSVERSSIPAPVLRRQARFVQELAPEHRLRVSAAVGHGRCSAQVPRYKRPKGDGSARERPISRLLYDAMQAQSCERRRRVPTAVRGHHSFG
jgi:hypothetical protein